MFNPTTPVFVETDERFVLETDQAPEFWQFLNGLRGDDLLVELIVNELDARSPRTEIRFETDRLLCVGRGEPVDEEGWARLRKIKGAGDIVKAKVGMFGVKNHGLKACFTLGDDILVRSAGQQILQTLFANGHSKPAFPGVRIPPRHDPDAPHEGTQIEVNYRRKLFAVPHGEALRFAAITDETIERLFRDAVATLPKRLLGIIRPGVLESYTLSLSHHALGRRTFEFSCGRIKREGGMISFFRQCRDPEAKEGEQLLEREQAVLSTCSPKGFKTRASFFQASSYHVSGKRLFEANGLVVEVAWGVDPSGRLKLDTGALRYPVAFRGQTEGTLTGIAVHYSGPFVSDPERHELAAQSNEWNDALIKVCDAVVTKALSSFMLRRHGARALELIASLPAGDRLKQFAHHLLETRTLPAVDQQGARVPIKRGARLLVPTYTISTSCWSGKLAAVAPYGEPIVDPKTPSVFVELLASGKCEGWSDTHIRFDEQDVIARLKCADAEHFPWSNEGEWKRALGQPTVARAHLDAIYPYLAGKTGNRPAGDAAHLPDGDGRLRPLSDLKRGASIPADIIGLDVPPVIHRQLKRHPVLKLEGWRLDSYAFRDMVRDGGLAERPASARKHFFLWLTQNAEQISRDDWPAVKALAIWPATDGSVRTFDELCCPEAKLAVVLGPYIGMPTAKVRKFCSSNPIPRARLKLRNVPTVDEIASFYRAKVATFPVDRPLTQIERSEFRSFERSVAALGRSNRMARALRSIATEAVALNREGTLRPVGSLVRETPEVARLRLNSVDLLDRPLLELDRMLPPARRPTGRMVLDALRRDAGHTESLLPRLRVITAEPDILIAAELSLLRCIPVDGILRAPNELAFKGNQGDFWGEWKCTIGVAGLPDDAQDLYRAAGVIRSYPTPHTSREFFAWLNSQPSGAVARNLDSVIRHLAHKNGVGSWLLEPPEVPCIPVEAAVGVELLTLSDARRHAIINDFPEVADAIRLDTPNPKLRLAILSVRLSSHPIGDQLREWGVPTLSSLANGPLDPQGRNVMEAPAELINAIRALAAPVAGRRFRKQLQEFDIRQTQVEPHFQKRLAAIKRIVLADELSVQFRIRKRSYRPRRSWAVLPDQIWLDADGDLQDLLRKAMADIIFVEPRPRYLRAVLKDVLSERARDFRPSREDIIIEQDEDTDHDDNAETAESTRRHPGSDPDPARNQPKPRKLYTGGGGTRNKGGGGSNQRSQVIAEDIQRRQLKAEHYAHHCQMELATRSPEQLAPVGSYVEFAENRRKIMEAHHPDKVGSSGSRHAGNLLILSRINHEKIGTRLSRAEITEALQHAWTPRTIENADGTTWLEGGVASAFDKVTGESLPLFFTQGHREYWLKMAGVAVT